MDDPKKKRFLLGILLAWLPLLALIPSLLNSFRGISQQKATGLGAIAGGAAEYFAILGMGAAFAVSVIAIVLLFRTLSVEHLLRSVVAILSICWSGLLLILLCLFVWTLYYYLPRHS